MDQKKLVLLIALLSAPLAAAAQDVFIHAGQHPVPAPAPAPPHHRPELGKWWKNSEIARELGLTEPQISQIEQTFLDHRLKLIDLKADVERQEAKFQPLLESDQVDEARISAQLDQLLAARIRLEKAHIMMMLSIRKVLSVEQWKKLEQIKHEREHPFGMEHQPHPGQPPQPAIAPAPPPGPRPSRPPRPPEEP